MASLQTPVELPSGATRGELRFVDPSLFPRLRGAAAAASMLFVDMIDVSSPWRGRLADLLEAGVEGALERRGAAPPGVGASCHLDASLSDQLYRSRHVGVRGIVVALGDLKAMATPAGVLEAEDSAVLRFWAGATKERPLVVLLDHTNRDLLGYGPPVALADLLSLAHDAEREAPQSRQSPLQPAAKSPPVQVATLEEGLPGSKSLQQPLKTNALVEEPAAVAVQAEKAKPEPTNPAEAKTESSPAAEAPTPPKAVAQVSANEHWSDLRRWRSHAQTLQATEGPKPLSEVERLFAEHYAPLLAAEQAGHVDQHGRLIRENFSRDFGRSYSDAFQALRVTGKRPNMVLDMPQMASRIARLHGARTTQLILVDGMSFDLGERIHRRLQVRLKAQAACAEKLLLWSALPSTTSTQLALLARGPDALGEALDQGHDDGSVHRGRTAGTIRRIRVGSRDLLKLDTVEARLQQPGPPLPERLDPIADEVSEQLSRYVDTLAARTLLCVFGDHGFQLKPDGAGQWNVHHGGPSPEEVLVPAYAWLVGDVH